jgi:hypothetical protein
MDAQINVGLGTGSRDRDMAMLNNILASQIAITDRFQMSGLADKAIDMMPKIRKTLVKIVEAAGIKNADSFYPDIDDEALAKLKQMAEQASQQPPPEVQAAAAKADADAQVRMQKQMLDDKEAERQANLKAMQISADLEREKYKIDRGLEAKVYQIDKEIDLKYQLGLIDATTNQNTSEDKVSIGGDPG